MEEYVNHHHSKARKSTSLWETTIAICRGAQAPTYLETVGHSHQRPRPAPQHMEWNSDQGTTLHNNWPGQEVECFLDVCHDAAQRSLLLVGELDAPKQVRPNLACMVACTTSIKSSGQQAVNGTDCLSCMICAPASLQQTQHRNGSEIQCIHGAGMLCNTCHAPSNDLLRPFPCRFCVIVHGDKIAMSC